MNLNTLVKEPFNVMDNRHEPKVGLIIEYSGAGYLSSCFNKNQYIIDEYYSAFFKIEYAQIFHIFLSHFISDEDPKYAIFDIENPERYCFISKNRYKFNTISIYKPKTRLKNLE